jgi:hypothetical protein
MRQVIGLVGQASSESEAYAFHPPNLNTSPPRKRQAAIANPAQTWRRLGFESQSRDDA